MLQHLLSDSSVSVNYDYNGQNRFKIFPAGSSEYSKAVECIKSGNLEDLITYLETNNYSNITAQYDGFEVIEGKVKVGNDYLPDALSARLVKFAQAKIPCQPLLNMWAKLKQNPSARAVREVYPWLEKNHHPIYPDGDVMFWKGVNHDYTDVFTSINGVGGKFNNSPGTINKVDRNQVDDDTTRECSFGFHVGSYQYAKNFGPKLVECKVNPADIVRVPSENSYQKVGVCAYEVIKDCTVFNQNQVVSSGDCLEDEPEKDLDDDYEDDDYEDDDDYESDSEELDD